MKKIIRLLLGKKNAAAAQCLAESFVGVDFNFGEDLTGKFPQDWRTFNSIYVPKFLAQNPGKTKIAAGLACGMGWTFCKGLQIGDIVLCPDGSGVYHCGEITGDYRYVPDSVFPHQRSIKWLGITIERSQMSPTLKASTGTGGTTSDLTNQRAEVEALMGLGRGPKLMVDDAEVDDPYAFAMEKHLEDFLVANWNSTDLGKDFDIYEEEGVKAGQQYLSDTGPIDILALSKDKKTLLVVELKRGRASDVVVGQVLRYMGYVQYELCEADQGVKGIIIALEDDQKLRRALSMVPAVQFLRYQMSFKLVKG